MPVPAPSVYSPLSRCGMPTANSMTSMPRWMSPRAVGNSLAVFEGKQFGEFVDVLVDQVDELHHHPGPPLRVEGGPFLLGLGRAGHGGIDIGRRCHRHRGLDLAGVGVHHVGGALRLPGRALAVDEMRNLCGHDLSLATRYLDILVIAWRRRQPRRTPGRSRFHRKWRLIHKLDGPLTVRQWAGDGFGNPID